MKLQIEKVCCNSNLGGPSPNDGQNFVRFAVCAKQACHTCNCFWWDARTKTTHQGKKSVLAKNKTVPIHRVASMTTEMQSKHAPTATGHFWACWF